ncbi:MAG: NYN domain-containing protein [Lachnospiraceae bacterium]|nr:NYN domain-containing protein [Lachnospiraceae bacterium]
MDNELRFAILIDADNVSDKYIKIILDETANNGIVTYKRIYGDWTTPRLASWKNILLENSIIPIQQYGYTSGKNSTDAAMIIDAMDILYSETVDGFCIVSSDSDFTRLAARLREAGMQVIGMGEEKTPKPFISACNQFKYLDLLYSAQQKEEKEQEQQEKEEKDNREKSALSGKASAKSDPALLKTQNAKMKDVKNVRRIINAIINKFSDEDGWLSTGKLGDQLSKRMPEFDVRNYGFSKLTPFIKSLGDYELQKIPVGGQKQIYVRLKEKKSGK